MKSIILITLLILFLAGIAVMAIIVTWTFLEYNKDDKKRLKKFNHKWEK